MFRIYGVRRQLLDGVVAICRVANECVRLERKLSKIFCIYVGVKPFNMYRDGVITEMKGKLGKWGVQMKYGGEVWWLMMPLCR